MLTDPSGGDTNPSGDEQACYSVMPVGLASATVAFWASWLAFGTFGSKGWFVAFELALFCALGAYLVAALAIYAHNFLCTKRRALLATRIRSPESEQ